MNAKEVQEITARLYAIGNAILEKTGERPWAEPQLDIKDDTCKIALYTGWRDGNYTRYGTAKGETPAAALEAADAIIAALPDADTARLQSHLKRVADCVDKAKADNIPDEYVTPLRTTIAAMSENLIGVVK